MVVLTGYDLDGDYVRFDFECETEADKEAMYQEALGCLVEGSNDEDDIASQIYRSLEEDAEELGIDIEYNDIPEDVAREIADEYDGWEREEELAERDYYNSRF